MICAGGSIKSTTDKTNITPDLLKQLDRKKGLKEELCSVAYYLLFNVKK